MTLEGVLSFHGADHPLTLPAQVEVRGGRVSADVELTVPYVEWGLEDRSLLAPAGWPGSSGCASRRAGRCANVESDARLGSVRLVGPAEDEQARRADLDLVEVS